MGTSLLGVLNMSQQSIANQQAALTVVSNNISNMNTIGYSKQSVVFNAIPAYDTYNWCSSIGSLQIGHGAEITAIQRNRGQWLDNYYREQNTSYGYYTQIGGMTNNIENMLNKELSTTGLQKKLSDFFTASQSLTSEPTNNAYRIAFVEAANGVAELLNSMSSSLSSMREKAVGTVGDPESFTNSQINMSVEELNDKLGQLAKVNGDIAQSMSSGSASNDLLDKRDMILDEISQYLPINTTSNSNGTVDLIIDGKTVVKGGEQRLNIEAVQSNDPDNPVRIQLTDNEGHVKKADISDSLSTGSLKAILDSGGTEDLSYQSVLNELDKLANAFATEMNRIQAGLGDGGTIPFCLSPDGKTLIPAVNNFFETKDGSTNFTAANIKVTDALLNDPNLVATARGPADLDPNAVGNTQNMSLFNGLANKQIDGLTMTGTAGAKQTLSNFITSLVSGIGSKIQAINSASASQTSVMQQADAKRTSYTGVDLNQELADLIKFQRAYEASARVFSAATELMQLLTQLGK